MNPIPSSELVLNPDGSVYHLHLKEADIADNVIVVGDAGRVKRISSHFETLELVRENREFITHTGFYKGKRITALSTGIGTDNIDIVVNELDAAVNIDLKTRTFKPEKRKLNLFRLGTSGALQEDIPVDSVICSSHGIGLDGLIYFYEKAKDVIDQYLTGDFIRHTAWNLDLPSPYVVAASEHLLQTTGSGFRKGMTATAPGFYGPQGRVLRLQLAREDLLDRLESFRSDELRITNFEMETSALYGLSAMLGHHAMTVCLIVANRLRGEFSKDYHKGIDRLIVDLLNNLPD